MSLGVHRSIVAPHIITALLRPSGPRPVRSIRSTVPRYRAEETRTSGDFCYPERVALSGGQNPFASILSCADSPIAPELCFDTARGDLFVCRIAGNFASDEMVASLEYAVQVLKTPLIMVLGHEACGAVDATIKSLKDGTTLPGHLPSLVAADRKSVV